MDPTTPDQPATEPEAAAAAETAMEAAPAAAPMAAGPPPAPPPAAPPAPTWRAPQGEPGPFPGLKFADHGKRLGSYVLDVIIVGLVTFGVAIAMVALISIFAAVGLDWLAALSGITLVIAVLGVSLGYWPYFWIKGGQTPGMKMAGGLRVVMDKDGGPVTLGPAVLRLIGYWIDGLIFYLGFVWVLIDSRRRGWHDLIAGTVVVQDE